MAKDKSMQKSNAKLNKRERGIARRFDRIRRYFREMYAELKKATWPSRKTLVKYTSVVLAFVIVLAVVIGLMDLGLTQLLKLITG